MKLSPLLLFLLLGCSESFHGGYSQAFKSTTGPEITVKVACEACKIESKVSTPGVVTILLALGEIASDKASISEEAGRLIAINAVKFASPESQPKILVVRDSNHQGESQGDTEFIAQKLLRDYQTSVLLEPPTGLEPGDLSGYDLVWFNNPGHPMGSSKTLATLRAFGGGVVLSGDDLSQGSGFSLEAFTGLGHLSNGTSMSCDGKTYSYDDNGGHRYQVELLETFLPGISPELLRFEYGNDIDDTSLLTAGANYEVLAYARGAPGTCETKRPVVVRYQK